MSRPKPPDRGLGGLADALLKAGVTPPPEEKPAPREERRRERGERPASDRGGSAERRGPSQPRIPRFDPAPQLDDARRDSLRERIRASLVGGRGPKRWFFVARDRRVPFVDVSEGVSKLLSEGAAGVVESLGAASESHVVVSDPQTLSALDEADPGFVRFWNRAR